MLNRLGRTIAAGWQVKLVALGIAALALAVPGLIAPPAADAIICAAYGDGRPNLVLGTADTQLRVLGYGLNPYEDVRIDVRGYEGAPCTESPGIASQHASPNADGKISTTIAGPYCSFPWLVVLVYWKGDGYVIPRLAGAIPTRC